MNAHPAKLTILIVEDEPKIAHLLIDYLRQANFDTHWIGNGDLAMQAFTSSTPDLVLLDLMLPGLDGMQVCRQIRAVSQVPIIMVTARVEEVDRLLGLELGADDYICKPFSPREVVARIKAILRRTGPNQEGRCRGPFTVDESRMTIQLDKQPLPLTSSEFKLLAALVARPGHVFSRDQLLDASGDGLINASDRAVDSHIKNLRKKIGAVRPGQVMITSVYGVGYRLDEE